MAWFRNHYECDNCGDAWADEWSCCCNDRCPSCNVEIEPYASEKLDDTGDEDEDKHIVVMPSTTSVTLEIS